MESLVNTHIKDMQTYFPPLGGRSEYDGLLLNFNERTTPPSPKVTQALQAFANEKRIGRYPDYANVPERIAAYAGVEPEQILITNGGEQGIDLVFRTFTTIGSKVVIPSPSFPLFYQYAEIQQDEILRIPYSAKDLAFPFAAIMNTVGTRRGVSLQIICNPNNPTGTFISLEQIESIVEKAPDTMILVDEAYFEFSGVTTVSLLKKYSNLIILRSFSKAFGLAGLRIGYLISTPENIAEVNKIRAPYNVNMAATVAAFAALEDVEDMRAYVSEVMKKAKPLVENFFRENDVPFYASGGNFILFKPQDSEQTFEFLQENGFLLRPQNAPEIQGTLRMTIGTEEQMQQFCEVYSKFH